VRKLLTAIVVLPVAAVLLIFALANRAPVTLSLDPFSPGSSDWSVQLPLFLIILLAMMVGVVIGSVADWLAQGRYRREARHNRHEVRRLEQETMDLRRAQMPPATSLPAPYMGDSA
jgi:uncharacterized integral membrane protein